MSLQSNREARRRIRRATKKNADRAVQQVTAVIERAVRYLLEVQGILPNELEVVRFQSQIKKNGVPTQTIQIKHIGLVVFYVQQAVNPQTATFTLTWGGKIAKEVEDHYGEPLTVALPRQSD